MLLRLTVCFLQAALLTRPLVRATTRGAAIEPVESSRQRVLQMTDRSPAGLQPSKENIIRELLAFYPDGTSELIPLNVSASPARPEFGLSRNYTKVGYEFVRIEPAEARERGFKIPLRIFSL